MISDQEQFEITEKVNKLFTELLRQYLNSAQDAYDAIVKSSNSQLIIEKNKIKFNSLERIIDNLTQAIAEITSALKLTEKEMEAKLVECKIPLVQPNDIFFQVIYNSIKKDIPEYIWEQCYAKMDSYHPSPIRPICEYGSGLIPPSIELYTPSINIDALTELFDSLTQGNLKEKVELTNGLTSYMEPDFMFGEYAKGYKYILYLANIDPNYIKSQKQKKLVLPDKTSI